MDQKKPFIASVIAADGQSARGRSARRNYPIRAYVGKNGSGKSWAAVADLLPDLEAGRPVLSTVRILDYRNPRPCELGLDQCPDRIGHEMGHGQAHPLFEPLTDWPQVLDWKQGPILLDEITGVMDSNEASGLPPAVGNLLAQLRRQDVSVSWTGLSFIRANKRLREATTLVTRCMSMLPKTTVATDGSERMWKQRQLSFCRSYDAQSLPVDDHTDAAYEKADHIVTSRHWIPTSAASRAYDTFDAVLRVGAVSDAGRCAYCGGTRRAPECSCSDYQERKPSRARRTDRTRASAEDRAPDREGTDLATVTTAGLALVPSVPHVHDGHCTCAVAG